MFLAISTTTNNKLEQLEYNGKLEGQGDPTTRLLRKEGQFKAS